MGERILLVEDDDAVGTGLAGLLAGAGYEVQWAQDVATALESLSPTLPDLVLLDLTLPDGNGLLVCEAVRERSDQCVVVVVSARSDEVDAVRALDSGADDFVLKPFRPGELLARVGAHLRRREVVGPADLRSGALRVDLRARRAWWRDVELPLRPKELDLLARLVQSAGTAVRREQLIDEVWDEHWHQSTKTLDVHVASIRRKLADAGDRWERISTLRGFGYRYEVD